MAPNSGFQGGPFAQISLGPVACRAAAGGISSLRAWLVLRLLESWVKCVRAPRQPAPRGGVHLPVPAQDRIRVALLWAGAEAETPHPPPRAF